MSVFCTIDITPVHTIKIGVVETIHRPIFIGNLDLHLIFCLAEGSYANIREYLIDLLWNPSDEQTLFPVRASKLHFVGVLQTLQQFKRPIEITQGIVNLGFLFCFDGTFHHIHHFGLTTFEDTIHF